jgi:integrase
MPRPRPPHLHFEQTRHGFQVWYVRRGHGPRIRIRAEYGSEGFWSEYRRAMEDAPLPSKMVKAQTLAWGLERYRNSSAWAALSNATRRQRENIYRAVIKTAGDVLLSKITTDTIKAGRERRAKTPHSANNFLKAMRGFFGWAADKTEGDFVTVDPTKGVRLLAGKNDSKGFHTWTFEELDRFEAHWPTGCRERLAFDFLSLTGLRRGDVVRVGKQHVRDGVITIKTEKQNRRSKEPIEVSVRILPPLAASIAATKIGDLTYLVNERNLPWKKESFGNWFADACRKAGCRCSAHGLRKAAAVRMAEHGATEQELMAVFGWTTSKMATHYTRAANRKKLALGAAELLLRDQPENEKVPHLGSGAGEKPKGSTKTGA